MQKRLQEIMLAVSLMFLVSGLITANSFAKATNEENTYKNRITIYLAGDSTVSDYISTFAPRAGWGQVIGRFFDDKIVVKNEAAPGRSSKSFIAEGRLKSILNQLDKGDYLFIQFGHNDQKFEDSSRYTEPHTTYKSYLKQYIDGARAKQAIPVLVTPVERRRFTEEGISRDSHGQYPAAMMELGFEENVPVIDLTSKSKAVFQTLGPEGTKNVFLWLKASQNKNYPKGIQDNTHFQETGAKLVARLVVEGIEDSNLVPLRNHILK
jgi:lysophospholipase L1-like esterase